MNRIMKSLYISAICLGVLLSAPSAGAVCLGNAEATPVVIQYGQAYTLSWTFDPRSVDRTVGFYGTVFEKNGREDKILVDLGKSEPSGSVFITPQTGGIFYFFGGVGDEGPISYAIQVKDGPDEGNFRVTVKLDKEKVQPGDTLSADAQLVEGRPPYTSIHFTWWIRDEQGREKVFSEETGPVSTVQIPGGIQGWVVATAQDAAGRHAENRVYFGIGDVEPLKVKLNLEKQHVQEQQPIMADWQISGGQPPYTENIYWNLTASGDGLALGRDWEAWPGQSAFFPEEPGYGTVAVRITDTMGRVVTSPVLRFRVTRANGTFPLPYLMDQNDVPDYPGVSSAKPEDASGITPEASPLQQTVNPLSVSAHERQKTVTRGLPVDVDWQITGGVPPYQVQYTVLSRYRGEEYNKIISDHIQQDAEGPGSASPILTRFDGTHSEVEIAVTDSTGTKTITSTDGFSAIEPMQLQATPGDGYVDLTWNHWAFTGEANLYAYENGEYRLILKDLADPGGTYRVSGLVNGQTYQYIIQHYDTEACVWSALDERLLVSVTPVAVNTSAFRAEQQPETAPPVTMPAPQADFSPASLIQRMATRSGPGTKYTEELGTLSKNTPIVLIESVTTHGTPWGMVEFTIKGKKYRAYTGMKRIAVQGPVAEGSEEYTEHVLQQKSESYYGPGYDYAKRKNTVKAGTNIRILKTENGFWLCDYKSGKSWVRAYLPVQ